jgi:hypothetical protein
VRSQDDLRRTMLATMTSAFQRLELGVPPARMTKTVGGPHMRYREKLPAQAVVQKLARIISGINALAVLHHHGFLQEQAVIQRTLDEIEEDITFICLAEIHENYTDLHAEYLEAFWMEEFNHAVVMKSTSKRPMIRRDKIRAHNIRVVGEEDPSTANTALRLVYKSYSGFVHAASPQVMDMCLGDPPAFQVSGTTDLHRLEDAYEEAWNYYYRGYSVICMATMAFGAREDVEPLMAFLKYVDAVAGVHN